VATDQHSPLRAHRNDPQWPTDDALEAWQANRKTAVRARSQTADWFTLGKAAGQDATTTTFPLDQAFASLAVNSTLLPAILVIAVEP
jgi:hypothetical protein